MFQRILPSIRLNECELEPKINPHLVRSETNSSLQPPKADSLKLSLAVSHGHSRMVTASPGILEIKATGDTIDVHDFASKEEARTSTTLHRLEVNLPHIHASTGDELVLVHALTSHLKGCLVELFNKSL